MKRFSRILLGLVLVVAATALTMVALNSTGDPPPGLFRVFTLLLSLVPAGAVAIFLLLWWSAFRTVIRIAVATMLIGAVLGLPVFLPPGATALYRGDSMGIGRMFGLVVSVAMLLWGGATWIGAAVARRASAKNARLLKFVAAVPTLVVVVVVALLVKSSYDALQPVVALPGVPSTANRPGSPPDEQSAGRPVPPPPPEDRGNATFVAATFDDTDTLLVTAIREPNEAVTSSERLQVWNARDGALLATIDAALPWGVDKLAPMLDSVRGRMLAERKGLVLVDLRTGREVARLPLVPQGPMWRPLTLVGDGNQALFATNGRRVGQQPGTDTRLELWQLDPPQLLLSASHPVPPPGSLLSWASTADRGVLAMAYATNQKEQPRPRLFVVDGATLQARELALPTAHRGAGVHGLAFSLDGRLLVVGGDSSLVVYDRAADMWVEASGFEQGSVYDIPKQVLASADGRRIVKIDEGLGVWVFDAATGARIGRSAQVPGGAYGSVVVSRDGNRIVLVRTASDTFELLDSRTADRVVWLCPYVCNVRPRSGFVKAAAAISADGRSVAMSHPAGAGIWESDTGRLRFPLRDPMRPPVNEGSR